MRTWIVAVALLLGVAGCAGAPRGEAPGGTGGDIPDAGDEPTGMEPTGGGQSGSTGSGEVLCREGADGPLPGGDAGCEVAPDIGRPSEVAARAGMADVRAIPWQSAEPVGDGSRVRLTWSGGVEPCYVLDRVEVVETTEEVTITLFEGSDPAQPDAVCIEIALTKATEVTLSAPLGDRVLVDGAAGG